MSDKIFTIPIPFYIDNPLLSSLREGISLNSLSEYSIDIPSIVILNRKIFVWGIAEHSRNIWNKASVNDYIFFYYKGNIVFSSKIIFKADNEKLATELWKKYLNDRFEHPYLIFFDKLVKVNLPYTVLIDFANYSKKASVRRFYEYSNSGYLRIMDSYKSIDNFIDKYRI